MRRTLVLGVLLTIGLVVFLEELGRSPAAAQAPAGLSGDVNMDGVVDALDSTLTMELSAGLIDSVPSLENADVDGNGRVETIDAALILGFDSGLLIALPPNVAGGPMTTGTASIGSGAVAVGEDVLVDLEALDVTSPGLGAWTIDVNYDATILSALSCSVSICNPCFGSFPPPSVPCNTGVVRVVGATASGLEGDSLLSEIGFRCKAGGTSALTIPGFGENPSFVFHDATIGSPQPIDVTIVNGSVACEPPPVGGIALDSDVRALPLETNGPDGWTWHIAIGIVAAACIIAVSAGWYARRSISG